MANNSRCFNYYFETTPVGQCLLRLKDGVATEVICGYTDLHHTIGWYHDAQVGTVPTEYYKNDDTFGILLEEFPEEKITGHYIPAVIAGQLKLSMRAHMRANIQEAKEGLLFMIGQWWGSPWKTTLNKKVIDWCLSNPEEALALVKERHDRLTEYYSSRDRAKYYRCKYELDCFKEWLAQPTTLLPYLKTLGI